MPPPAVPARYDVLGVQVSALTLAAARDLILGVRGTLRRGYVCVTGVHGIIASQDDPELKRVHNDAWLVTPDGMPLVWLGPRGVERVYGPDLLLAVCDAGRAVGLTHYFYGGEPGVAATLRARLTARFPGLAVVGEFTPPFRPLVAGEVAALRAEVARVRPDVIWVGLSTPKQEHFMAEHGRSLDAGVLIAVGAAFDIHAGRVRQAPRWMQRGGLEWLFRLGTEPRRLAPRYLRNNPRFVLLLLREKLLGGDRPEAAGGETPTPAGATLAVSPGRTLCVDLDHTWLKVDTAWDVAVAALRQRPWALLRALWFVRRDLARAKVDLAAAVEFDLASLPIRPEVAEFVRRHRAQGGEAVLATASPQSVANRIAAAHGGFTHAWGTTRDCNLKGRAKGEFLAARFGSGGFDYLGDSSSDHEVWRHAARKLVIAPAGIIPPSVRRADLALEPLPVAVRPGAWWRALRPYQWAKNLLVFVPLLTSHRLFDPAVAGIAGLAAVALSLVASALYVINDMLDAPHDRLHPQKRFRPVAAGDLSIPAAGGLAVVLLATGAGLGLLLPPAFAAWLAAYFALGLAYTVRLKRIFLLDAAVLVVLHLARILMGCVATDIACSRWLLVFALLLLGSLALLKRYIEVLAQPEGDRTSLPGRGAYSRAFLAPISLVGQSLGLGAALIFVPYLFSAQAHLLYRHPIWIAGAALAVGAWVMRAWQLARARRLPSDPVIFALTDPPSYALGGILLLALWFAT